MSIFYMLLICKHNNISIIQAELLKCWIEITKQHQFAPQKQLCSLFEQWPQVNAVLQPDFIKSFLLDRSFGFVVYKWSDRVANFPLIYFVKGASILFHQGWSNLVSSCKCPKPVHHIQMDRPLCQSLLKMIKITHVVISRIMDIRNQELVRIGKSIT